MKLPLLLLCLGSTAAIFPTFIKHNHPRRASGSSPPAHSTCLEICGVEGGPCNCLLKSAVIECSSFNLPQADVCIADKTNVPKDAKFRSAHMQMNQITELRRDDVLPEMAEDLIHIDFAHNRIGKIEDKTFEKFYNLKQLELSQNHIRNLTEATLLGLVKLDSLDLTDNWIEDLTRNPFAHLRDLRYLRLDHNPIQRINDYTFSRLEKLVQLSLDDTELHMVTASWFAELKLLKSLSLKGNRFVMVPPLSGLPSLERLSLSGNTFKEINKHAFGGVHTLTELYLQAEPNLRIIDDCAFCDLRELQTLILSNNKHLTHIDANAFGDANQRPRHLNHLDLSNNGLATLAPGLLSWHEIPFLNLAENPWECDCRIAWMIPIVRELREPIICAGPPNLAGQDLRTLAENDLACPMYNSVYGLRRGRFLLALLVLTVMIAFVMMTYYVCCHRPSSSKAAAVTNRVVSRLASMSPPAFVRRGPLYAKHDDDIQFANHDALAEDSEDEFEVYRQPAPVAV